MRKMLVVRLLGLGLFLASCVPLLAQGPADAGLQELEKNVYDHRDLINKMFRGEVIPSAADAQQMKALDHQARLITYRLANKQFQTVGGTDDRKTINWVYNQFDAEIKGLLATKDKTRDLARLYSDKLIEHSLEVVKTDMPIAQVNAARMLARVAVLGNPKLADACVGLVKDEKVNDAVRYYALRGLRDLLALPPQTPPLLTKDAEESVAAALRELITRKVTFNAVVPLEEVDGYRLMRREAIRALGHMRTPAVNKERPALVLLQVLAGEGFVPRLRIDERMEAATGLARTRPDKAKDYQVDYAVEQISQFLDEWTKYVQTRDAKYDRKPVRILAAQLLDALIALKAETGDAYVAQLFDTGKPGATLLDKLEKGLGADASDLINAVTSKPAPGGQLFKSIPESKLVIPKAKE